MKKNMLLIAGATLLISAFSAGLIRAQTCIQPPTCEELGYIYSADECVNGNNILKCPTDLSKMACSFDAIGNDGDILYADHSTSSEVINAKTPIAVIFDAGNRLAVSLEAKIYQKGDSVIWGAEGDIPGLANCSGTDCEDSSITNTNMIMCMAKLIINHIRWQRTCALTHRPDANRLGAEPENGQC